MGNKILLVEDDPDLSGLLLETLKSSGYQVELCESGREALAALRSYDPDLLLMDVMLPGLDGHSLAADISNDGKFNKLPIIVMSALTNSRCMFEGLPQVAAFFPKPFNTEDLIEAIKTALAEKP